MISECKDAASKRPKKYTIMGLIGVGRSGKVFKGECNGIYYAIKIVSIKSLNNSKREQDVINIINGHPNIVKAYDIIKLQKDEQMIYVMELCDCSLYKHYNDYPAHFTEEFCIHIIKDVIQGFVYICSKNVMHRDIKCDNIMLLKKGENDYVAKLGDFGFSRILDLQMLDQSKTPLGTKTYMSPEMLNKGMYDFKSDIFSIGVVYFYILFGIFPCPYSLLVKKTNWLECMRFYEKGIIKVTTNGKYVSQESLDFLKNCLQFDRTKRPEINQLEKFEIFTSKYESIQQNTVKSEEYTININ